MKLLWIEIEFIININHSQVSAISKSKDKNGNLLTDSIENG